MMIAVAILFTQRRSIAKNVGCFQRRLFVCYPAMRSIVRDTKFTVYFLVFLFVCFYVRL